MNLFTRQAMIAALYTSVSVAIAPLSFGLIQVRFAETLMLLVFINPQYSISLIIGCFITNLFSPLGMIDAAVGTFATALSCYTLSKTKKIYYSLLYLPLINGILVGAELAYLWKIPLLMCIISVAAGEFVAILIGVVLYKRFEKLLRRII